MSQDTGPETSPTQRAEGSPAALQRAFMDRARRAVEREHEKPPLRLGQKAIALLAACGLAFGIVYVFASFLGGMQRVLDMLNAEEQRQQQAEAEKKKKEPMPAYVVPSD
jgi:ferric-dicitrate binding protein FerR (iron transport regulator)